MKALKEFVECCYDFEEKLFFERASEPSDIYWENWNVSDGQRMGRMILTYLATLILIAACFWIIYGLNLANKTLN